MKETQTMKKLMIIAAAMSLAVSALASQAKWSMDLGAEWDEYDAYTYYVIAATDMSSAYALVKKGDSAGFSEFLGSKNYASNNDLDLGETAGTISNVTASDSLYVFVVEDTGLADGTEFLYADAKSLSGYTYDLPSPAPGTLKFTSFTSEVVTSPEPTSGLLLLIGMAGLALKRRRA